MSNARIGTMDWILGQTAQILREWRQPQEIREARFQAELQTLEAQDARRKYGIPRPSTLRRLEPARVSRPSPGGRILSQSEEDEMADWEFWGYYRTLPESEKERRRLAASLEMRRGIDLCRHGRRRSSLYW